MPTLRQQFQFCRAQRKETATITTASWQTERDNGELTTSISATNSNSNFNCNSHAVAGAWKERKFAVNKENDANACDSWQPATFNVAPRKQCKKTQRPSPEHIIKDTNQAAPPIPSGLLDGRTNLQCRCDFAPAWQTLALRLSPCLPLHLARLSNWNVHKPYLKCFEVAPPAAPTPTLWGVALETGAKRLMLNGCPLDTIRAGFAISRPGCSNTCPVLIAAINEWIS